MLAEYHRILNSIHTDSNNLENTELYKEEWLFFFKHVVEKMRKYKDYSIYEECSSMIFRKIYQDQNARHPSSLVIRSFLYPSLAIVNWRYKKELTRVGGTSSSKLVS